MPSYLFHPQGLADVRRHVAADTLFAFDLDGALAPFLESPAAATNAEQVRDMLTRLVELAKVVVVSGRSRNEAQAVLGFEPHLVIGSHGAEWPRQYAAGNFNRCCLGWRQQLADALGHIRNIEIELNNDCLLLHYRNEKALSLINTALDRLEPCPRRISGRNVVKVVPAQLVGKEDAVSAAIDCLGSARAVYFGEEWTGQAPPKVKPDLGPGAGNGRRSNAAPVRQAPGMVEVLNIIVGTLESSR